MLCLEKLILTDYGLYPNAEFDFESGVTVVRGGNRSGKSLLFSAISPILFDEGGFPDQGRAMLMCNKNGVEADISAWKQRANPQFSLVLDGVDQQTDTIEKSRTAIDSFVGISSALASSLVVSSSFPHPLSIGKAASRLEWVHRALAYSDLYDAYLEKVERLIKEVKPKATEYEFLNAEYLRLCDEEPSVPAHNIKFMDVGEELSRLTSRRDKLRALIDLPKKPKLSQEEIQLILKELRLDLADLKLRESEHRLYNRRMDQWESENEEYTRLWNDIKDRCKDLNIPSHLINVDKLPNAIDKQLDKLTKKHAEQVEQARIYAEQAEQRDLVDDAHILFEGDIPEADELASFEDELKEVNKHLAFYDVSHTNSEDVCSLCGKDLAALRANVEKKIKKLKNRSKWLNSAIATLRALDVDLVAYVNPAKLATKIKDLRQIQRDIRSLPTTSKPVPPESDPPDDVELEMVEQDVDYYEDLLRSAQRFDILSKQVADVESDDPEQELKEIAKSIENLSESQRKNNEAFVKQQTAEALYQRWDTECTRLEEKLNDLKSYPARLKRLMVLKKAFGRDGMRVETLESSLELYLSNLNQLAPLVWPEPFKFEIDLGPRKCDMIVHRNKKRSTVYTLSGSEQRGWQLLSALSLIRILPDQSRCDTIILDEPEANMDKSSRDRLIYEFLPELRRSIDKVVFVTPLMSEEFPVPADRRFEVVKKNGQSSLIGK